MEKAFLSKTQTPKAIKVNYGQIFTELHLLGWYWLVK